MRCRGTAGRPAAHLGLGAERREVAAIAFDGAAGASSTKVRLGRAARERLEAERARAGEQVEHARAVDAVAQDREQRLAHAVGGRARGVAGRRLQAPSAPRAGDDPHPERAASSFGATCFLRLITPGRSSTPSVDWAPKARSSGAASPET